MRPRGASGEWRPSLLCLRVSGSYAYRGRVRKYGEPFVPRDRKEERYLLSIGGDRPIFEEVTGVAETLEWLGRELALPIWQSVSYFPARLIPKTYLPGRIIKGDHCDGSGRLLIERDDLWEDLGPNDILYVPLYVGDCEHGGPGTAARLPCHEENLAFAKSVAGTILGVTFGNAGPEMGLKTMLAHGATRREVVGAEAAMLEEFQEVADEIGLPLWVGPIDINVALDCYYGDALLRDTALHLGVTCIVYCGFKLENGQVPGRPPVGGFCPRSEEPPFPVMRDYISGGNFWTGMGWHRRGAVHGLTEGDDIRLADFGFKAAVTGIVLSDLKAVQA